MRCTLLTPRVQHWLQASYTMRILHLFDETCNLINDKGDIISLVSPRIGPGPFALILEENFINYLDITMPVRFDPSAQTLSIGSFQIETGNAYIWNSRPQWHHLQDIPAGFLTTNQPGIMPLPAGLDEPLERLLQGITTNDRPTSYAGAYGLAGCGSGLTPTGDDVLMGVLYGLWVWHPQQNWMELILEAAVPRTTSLSAAFLRAAAAGEATVHWHDLANGDSTAVERILAVGHRSGQEAWTGFTRARTILGN